jgi:hypothetical protein
MINGKEGYYTPRFKDGSKKHIDFGSTHTARAHDRLTLPARDLYADVCSALDCADQDNNEYCLLVSNFADDIATFISGMELLRDAALS